MTKFKFGDKVTAGRRKGIFKKMSIFDWAEIVFKNDTNNWIVHLNFVKRGWKK